jgi:hypothetical protein
MWTRIPITMPGEKAPALSGLSLRYPQRNALHTPLPPPRWRPERIGRIAQPAILFDPANRFRFGDECRHYSRR